MRVFSCGFEFNSITIDMPNTLGTNPTTQSSVVHGGGFAAQVSGLGSTVKKGKTENFVAANNNGPYFFRWYFNFATFPAAENRIGVIENSSGVDIIYFTIDNTGVLRLYDEDGQIGSASGVLQKNTWHCIEVKYDRTPAAGSQIVRARLNETEFAGATNRDLSTGIDRFGFGGNLNSEVNTTGLWYVDDLAVNDNTIPQSGQASYPGAGYIVHLLPNAAGDNSAWSNDYTKINEVTPDGATSIIAAGTTGNIEDVNLADTPAAIDANDLITVVAVGIQMAAASGSSTHPSLALRVKQASGGGVEESALQSVTSTSYRINNPAAATPNNYLLTSNKQWTKALLDSAQIGVRLTNTPAGNMNVSNLWLMVEYMKRNIKGVSTIQGVQSITL